VNGQRYVEYFGEMDHRWELCAPFFYTGTLTDFDMIAVVSGGGLSGQSGAIKHAAAKALQNYDRQKYRPMLKKRFLLSRDARVVERKKYGRRKARKQFAFVKR
jgi:small subunit ribosomal protein S9